jgi:tetratricopeptide (TPR) repeat protein
VKYFEKALGLAPGANRIHYSLAMAYRGAGDTQSAKTHLAQQGTVGVRVSDPLMDSLEDLIRGERIHLIRGKLAADSGRYREAADEFRKALAANGDNLATHINLGTVLIQLGDAGGAAAQFEDASRIDPKNTTAHYNLAILLSKGNRHDAAIPHLQTVVGLQPDDLAAGFFLAQELTRAQRWDEALTEYSRVVEADPNNEEALLMQARLLFERKKYQQALAGLRRGHEQYPQKIETALLLAYLLATVPEYELRDGALALKLAQAIYQTSKSPEHGAVAALALAELGRCVEAADWLRRMIALAQQARNAELVARLESDLKLYDGKTQCRP